MDYVVIKLCYNPNLFIDCDEIIKHQMEFKSQIK